MPTSNFVQESFPKGKLIDLQVRVCTPGGGAALIGALNGRKEFQAVFFDNVEITRVGFTSFMKDGNNPVSDVANEVLARLDEYGRTSDLRVLGELEQYLLGVAHSSVSRG